MLAATEINQVTSGPRGTFTYLCALHGCVFYAHHPVGVVLYAWDGPQQFEEPYGAAEI